MTYSVGIRENSESSNWNLGGAVTMSAAIVQAESLIKLYGVQRIAIFAEVSFIATVDVRLPYPDFWHMDEKGKPNPD